MIDQDPGPGLYILPDENTGRKHLQEKVITMINASPELAKYKTNNSRDISFEKVQLKNMVIYPAWAGSIQSMNSFPMKRVFLDEVRLMSLTIGSESNAIKLAGDRLTTYLGYGLGQGYMVSSPSTEGDLLHQQLSIPGTLYVSWQVPCPVCGEFQELDFFKNIADFTERSSDGVAVCHCIYCSTGVFSDLDRKRSFNAKGKYAVVEYENEVRRPSKIYKDGSREIPFEFGVGHNRVFFHWSSMESPFRSFQQIWNEYVQTKGKLHDYKNFVQCWLARFWIDDKSKTSAFTLQSRRKSYRKGQVPSGVKIITAGIDTQDSGFYVAVRGHGADGFTPLIDEFKIPCAMVASSSKEITKLFNDLIFNRIYDRTWQVALAAIDVGGHRTKELYLACNPLPRMIMCKGATDTQVATMTYNKDLNLYLIRTHEYLDETDSRSLTNSFWLPEDVSKDFITQYVNRRKTEAHNKRTGENSVVWKRIGQDDFRYADVHSFICLDVPTDKWGNLRQQLNVDDFVFNPYQELQALKQQQLNAVKTSPQSRGASGRLLATPAATVIILLVILDGNK